MTDTQLVLASKDENLPAYLQNSADRGNENVGNAVAIPRIKQLQKMNNEVDKNHKAYIPGAEPGDFVNTVTEEVIKDSLYVISLTFKIEYAVWRDLEKGGGFGGDFATRAEAQAYVDQQENPSEWDINETHSHVLLLKDPDTGEVSPHPVIMNMASSKLRVSKAWNTQIGMKGGDRFASLWKISSVSTENKAGQAFLNLDIKSAGWCLEPDYLLAEKIYERFA